MHFSLVLWMVKSYNFLKKFNMKPTMKGKTLHVSPEQEKEPKSTDK